jgi:hypothetical protein
MRLPFLALSAALLSGVPAGVALQAQMYPPSQRTSITQHVALTTITLDYGRPVARGRTLWGALVPWDSVWHPGADSASRITLDHDVTIEGKPLAAGTYSLWLIPRATGAWTLMFNRDALVDHKSYGGPSRDALRVDVMPDSLSPMESMAIYFPMVLRDEATLRIHWGERAVSAKVKAGWREE